MHAWQTIIAAGSLLASIVTAPRAQDQPSATGLAHTREEFRFTANAPLEQVAPLFGADEERKWAPDWKLQFVYPNPAHDQQGMVFQVAHGPYANTWVNTAFDLAVGHIQYACLLNDAMVTTIEIRLSRDGALRTGVSVVYERTALITEANEHVQHFAAQDRLAGKQWESQINGYLAKSVAQK